MKKIYSPSEEHYLVPAVLFLFNVCLAHLIYAFAISFYPAADKITLTLAFVLFGASLLFKGKLLLSGSILFYALVVIFLIAV
jgi:hypothetical protein